MRQRCSEGRGLQERAFIPCDLLAMSCAGMVGGPLAHEANRKLGRSGGGTSGAFFFHALLQQIDPHIHVVEP